MSDLTPFEVGGEIKPYVASGIDVFTPDLADFDFVAYAKRQAALDNAFRGGREDVAQLIQQFHNSDPETGVMLNNLHNTQLVLPSKYLNAALTVLTHSTLLSDVVGANFRAAVATEVDLSGRDLTGSDFTDSVLPGSNLKGANLRGVSMVNAVLNGSDFTGADLLGTDLRGAYLIGAKGLTAEQLRRAQIRGARTLILPDQNSTLAQQLSGYFSEVVSEDDLRALLDATPLSIEQKPGTLQSNKVFRGLVVEGGVWDGVDFTGSTFVGASIGRVVARQVILRAAKLSGATFSGVRMSEADLVSAWAPGAIFEDVDLRNAQVTGANLSGAVFRNADLRGVTGLEARNSNLNGVVIDEGTRLPQGYGFDGWSIQASAKKQRELDA